MQLFALITGLESASFPVTIEPHDKIATLLDALERQFVVLKLPLDIVVAYSLLHTTPTGLMADDPDFVALEQGDPDAVAKFLTPLAHLDLQFKIADYFGTSEAAADTASIAVTMTAEALAVVAKRTSRCEETRGRDVEAATAAWHAGRGHEGRCRGMEDAVAVAHGVMPAIGRRE